MRVRFASGFTRAFRGEFGVTPEMKQQLISAIALHNLPVGHFCDMKLSLLGSGKLWLFLAALLLLAGGFSFEAAKGWLAAHWAASAKSEDWFRAANLEPGSADTWHRLGLLEQGDM